MNFPTTANEAMSLTPEKAEEMCELIGDAAQDKMNDYDPDPRIVLSIMIDMLNRVSTLPDNPFGAEGWISYVAKKLEGSDE